MTMTKRKGKKTEVMDIPKGQLGLFVDETDVVINPDFLFEDLKVVPVNVLAELPNCPRKITNLNELKIGDKIRIYDSNTKNEFCGYFVTKGFWDGRDQDDFYYYYMEILNEKQESSIRRFKEFTPRWEVMLIKSAEDTNYIPPRKDNVAELLTEKLRGLTARKAIEVYQGFKRWYPDLSYEWSPILRDAWDKAITNTTSEKEFLKHLIKGNREKGIKIPKIVQEQLIGIFKSSEQGKRLEKLSEIRWIETIKDLYDKEIACKYYRVNKNDYTYFKPLTKKFLEDTKDVKFFLEIIKHLGFDYQHMMKNDIDIKKIEPIASSDDIRIWLSEEWLESSYVPLWRRKEEERKIEEIKEEKKKVS